MKKAPEPGGDRDDTLRLQSSIDGRIARLTAALGDPFHEDSRLAYYATALADADASPPRARTRAPSAEFLSRVDALLAAREIALSVVEGRSARGAWDNVTHRALALFDVESLRRGHVRTLGALKQLETEFFTEWNESPPRETKAFWKAIEQAGLPFARR
jgi:hypothetical protein